MTDIVYRSIAIGLVDPENQPHQWTEYDLAQFFTEAADEIERLREKLNHTETDLKMAKAVLGWK